MGCDYRRAYYCSGREGQKMIENEITKIVKRAIKHVGSGTDLAKILGINRSSVSRWLHGVHIPRADYMIAMSAMVKGKKK
jgi:hypothetical protein